MAFGRVIMGTRQIIANRRNAELSTGPSTDQGKAAVRYNALRHGLRAKAVVLPGESQSAYKTFRTMLAEDLKPATALESCLFELVVTKLWRVLRAQRVEAETLQENWSDLLGRDIGLPSAFKRARLDLLQRYETGLERGLYRALGEYRALKAESLAKEPIAK